jgi:hypothetical protein
MIKGVLLAESLRLDATVAVPGLQLHSVRRSDVSASATDDQPDVWTFIEFTGPESISDQLAQTLSGALRADGGWYVDYSTEKDHVVIFSGRVFRYRKGDAMGRAEARAHGLSLGTPEHQLDWPD